MPLQMICSCLVEKTNIIPNRVLKMLFATISVSFALHNISFLIDLTFWVLICHTLKIVFLFLFSQMLFHTCFLITGKTWLNLLFFEFWKKVMIFRWGLVGGSGSLWSCPMCCWVFIGPCQEKSVYIWGNIQRTMCPGYIHVQLR